MTDEIDSAFVEIVASVPEVDVAAERLVPLYEDTAATPTPSATPPSRGSVRHVSGIVLASVLVLLVVAGVWLLLRVAVWFGEHGMLPAPN